MSRHSEPVTLQQQAELLDYICSKLDRSPDGKAVLNISMELDRKQVEDLNGLARRLHLMAPHQQAIENGLRWGFR